MQTRADVALLRGAIITAQPGMAVVTVTPTNGFNQQVQFSCSNVPERD